MWTAHRYFHKLINCENCNVVTRRNVPENFRRCAHTNYSVTPINPNDIRFVKTKCTRNRKHNALLYVQRTVYLYVMRGRKKKTQALFRSISVVFFLHWNEMKCQFILNCVIDARRATATFWLLVCTRGRLIFALIMICAKKKRAEFVERV